MGQLFYQLDPTSFGGQEQRWCAGISFYARTHAAARYDERVRSALTAPGLTKTRAIREAERVRQIRVSERMRNFGFPGDGVRT